MPITSGNTTLINLSERWKKGSKPTIAQFFYTFAPPNENDTENYIATIINNLNVPAKRTTLVFDLI